MVLRFMKVECEGVVYDRDFDVLKRIHFEEVEREIQSYLLDLLYDSDILMPRFMDISPFLISVVELVHHAFAHEGLSHRAPDRTHFRSGVLGGRILRVPEFGVRIDRVVKLGSFELLYFVRRSRLFVVSFVLGSPELRNKGL